MQSFIENLTKISGRINEYVWGMPTVLIILLTGVYMTLGTGFFQVFRAKHISRETFLAIFRKKSVTKSSDKKSISQFQAMATSLAATIGTGNIAGVATAIVAGGAGAVFWMWVSAFFGMMTSFAENVLGIYYRRRNRSGEWSGGAMYYIRDGLMRKKGLSAAAGPLSKMFALFCVFASFGIGNMSQVNTISESLRATFDIPAHITGAVLAVFSGLVILGGIKAIARVTELVVPFMAVAYIAVAACVIIDNAANIPYVFHDIFSGAFGGRAILGGVSGVAVKEAMSVGFKRGVFSNEAGLGSTVIVHSASDVKEPVVQGMWGIFEVFFDTIVGCSLTAFILLSSNVLESGTAANGAALIGEALSGTFHSYAGPILSVSVCLFAFSTVLGWSFTGTKALEYLAGKKATAYYKIIFVLFVFVGATMQLELVWGISDTLNALMALPNLIGILALSGQVFKITDNYVKRKLKKKRIKPMLSFHKEYYTNLK